MTSWGKTCISGLYGQSYDRENQVKAVEKLLQIQSSEERFQNLTTHSPAGPSRSSAENMGAVGHVVITLLFTLKNTQCT